MSRSLSGYQDIRDMIDGGGAGMSGKEFEGGGAISGIANALFDPLGSRAGQQLGQVGQPMSAIPPMSPMMNPAATPPTMPQVERMTPATAYQAYQPPMPGPNPSTAYVPSAMSFEQFVQGLGPVAQSASPEALRNAYEQFIAGYGNG